MKQSVTKTILMLLCFAMLFGMVTAVSADAAYDALDLDSFGEPLETTYKTIYEDTFDSAGSWGSDATLSCADGILRAEGIGQTAASLNIVKNITFKANTKYRISYRTKTPGGYFLLLNLNGSKAQTTPSGGYSKEIYDHTVSGGRGDTSNGTSEWVDVSYEISFYGMQDKSGATAESVTTGYFGFKIWSAAEGTTCDFLIDSIKIEEETTVTADEGEEDSVLSYRTIFEDNFDSAGKWTCDATLSCADGILRAEGIGQTAASLNIVKNITFRANKKYRISYRTKTPGGYFLLLNLNGSKVQTTSGGGYSKEIYDHTVPGGRGTTDNGTSDWYDVSYEISFYDMQDKDGAAVDSVTTGYFGFKIWSAETDATCDFLIDSIRIEEETSEDDVIEEQEEICETVYEESFDSAGDWTSDAALSCADGILKLTGIKNEANTTLINSNINAVFKENTRYRVTYRTKTTGGYFLVYNLNGTVQTSPSGKFSKEFYDHTVPGGRGTTSNESSEWGDVSYEISLYDMQTTGGDAVSSLTPGHMRFLIWANEAGTECDFEIDSIKIESVRYAEKPVFSPFVFNTAPMEGYGITVDFGYEDADSQISEIKYSWQISSDNKNWSDIDGTSTTCTVPENTAGKYLRFRCLWYKEGKTNPGGEAVSDAMVIAAKKTPAAISGLELSEQNGEFTAVYDYVPGSDNQGEGDSRFLWEVSENGTDGWRTVYEGTDGKFSSVGMSGFVRVSVTPKDSDGVSGETKMSEPAQIPDVEAVFYVAANGSENAKGTIDDPFADIEQARDAIRSVIEKGIGRDVTVYIRGGVYYRSEAFTLGAEDSGNGEYTVTYAAYPGEKVIFTGGKTVTKDKISKVTDEKILGRIIDKAASEKLMQIDLSDIYDTIPEIPDYSHINAIDGTAKKLYNDAVRIFINGTALTEARWPNEGDGDLIIDTANSVKNDISSFTFTDKDGRTKLWSDEVMKDLYYEGHEYYHWTYSTKKISELDKEAGKVTFANVYSSYLPAAGMDFYFKNILEEIDVPGESYIDRENRIVYFYPFVDMEDAEVTVPVEEATFLIAENAKNITISGIDFEYVRNSAFEVTGAENIVIENCNFRHYNKINSLEGKDITFRNNHVYDGASGGIDVTGGDPKTLEPSGILIENNVLDSTYTLRKAYAGALNVYGCEVVVKNNEISNGAHYLVCLGGKDHKFTGNEIHHGVQWAGDIGAVYFGRSADCLGYEFVGNYFHHNGTGYASGWSQSIFWDDGAIGPKVEGNIFYQGTYPYGTGNARNFALKTNGGQYSLVKNNIFVENPYAVQFQNWSAGWWLYIRDLTLSPNYGLWQSSVADGQLTDENHRSHYAGTQWEAYINSIDLEQREELSIYNPAYEDDAAKLYEISLKNYDPATNVMTDNVVIKSANKEAGLYSGSAGTETNSYIAVNDILPSGNSMFVEYGRDFTLTDEGLAAVRTKAPGFSNVNASAMGIYEYESNGENILPGGNAPAVSDAVVIGTGEEGSILTASYAFSDADSDKQGNSKIEWYISRGNGRYDTTGVQGSELEITSELVGKKIVFAVTPVDENGRSGETVYSSDVFVKYDTTEAESKIADAEKLVSEAVAGTEPGNYPQSAVDTLKEAIETAKAAIENAGSQSDVDDIIKNLERAVTVFNNRVVRDTEADTDDNTQLPSAPSSGGGGGASRPAGGSSGGVFYSGETSTPALETEEAFVFSDMITHWAKTDVMSMYNAGIVSGVTSTTFEPDRKITRAEFATLITKTLGLSEEKTQDFEDVKDEWFAPFVGAAAKAGIIVGSGGNFRPNDTITREEMAVIVVKAYEYSGKTAEAAELTFSDNSELSGWAESYVAKAVGAGLISGMGDNSFAPKANATRAQSASLVSRLLK